MFPFFASLFPYSGSFMSFGFVKAIVFQWEEIVLSRLALTFSLQSYEMLDCKAMTFLWIEILFYVI